MMLIHEQPPGPRPWSPNWHVWRWVAIAVPVAYASTAADGAIGFLLLIVAFYAVCRALADALPGWPGMREHKQ
jgi:hypothetical protein